MQALQEIVKELDEITINDVAQFNAYVQAGIESWIMAGQLLVRMTERNPNAYSIIMADNPHLSIDLLLAFERIGRKEIYPYWLLEKAPTRLLALPYDLQVKYYRTPVELVTAMNNGTPKVEKKLAKDMSPAELRQAFDLDGARTVEAQAALLKVQPVVRGHGRPRKTDSPKPKLVGYVKVEVKDGKIVCEPVEYYPVAQTIRVHIDKGVAQRNQYSVISVWEAKK